MKTSFHGSFSLSCSFPHPSFASRRYFSVLIAPLFAIFVLHDALPGRTRERGRKSSREESDEKWGEEKSFRRSSSPLHSRALRRRFSDALHLFIGTRTGLLSSLSLSFFSSSRDSRYSHRSLYFECDCKRAADSLDKNAISAMTFFQTDIATDSLLSSLSPFPIKLKYNCFPPFVVS